MNLFFSRNQYSLRKSKKILKELYQSYLKKKKRCALDVQSQFEPLFISLATAIGNKQAEEADKYAKKLESLALIHLRKGSFAQIRDLTLSLGFALFVAILVRQMWFELYEIPTGSMRPTLKEKDRLIVSKTDFGINFPLLAKHLYFKPELLKRSGIIVFTGENVDIHDVDTMYFYVLPGKKQFIKRLIGKPGDSLYFYGGKIYGVDKFGNDISSELQLPGLSYIDHIPFIYPQGKVTSTASHGQGIFPSVIVHQMNQPVAKLHFNEMHHLKGEILPRTAIQYSGYPKVQDYFDLWGFKNYATARILSESEVLDLTDLSLRTVPKGKLYLELKHHPSIQSLKLQHDEFGRLRPMLGTTTSIIPLQEKHLQALLDNLYTARFVVKNGKAMRYGLNPKQAAMNRFLPSLSNVPDGTYEFYHGKAYEILWQGISKELPKTHPLYENTPERVKMLFNLGIEFDVRFAPQGKNQPIHPSRYAYFRNEDLYVAGAKIYPKDDPILSDFTEREYARQSVSTSLHPFYPFEDLGAPLRSDGTINVDFIRHYGITVPEKNYLVLGDNHAMSADSRDFGFVPEDNLRGSPDLLFWPLGSRFGFPVQPSFPLLNTARVIVWLFFGSMIAYWYYHERKKNQSLLQLRK